MPVMIKWSQHVARILDSSNFAMPHEFYLGQHEA